MDRALVVRAQQGDQQAFASLTIAVGGRLQRAAIGILRDHALAEDALQQTLLAIWRHLPSLRDPDRFEAWSYRMLVNACRAEARRTRRWFPNVLAQADETDDRSHHEPVAADVLGVVIDRDQLERGFRSLNVDQRAVVVLRMILDLEPEAVAAALSIPVGTVHSRLSRALRAMRASIEADARSPLSDITTREVAR